MSNLARDHEKINRELHSLAPFLQKILIPFLDELHERGLNAYVFEAARSNERQAWLYEQGRTRPGKIITHARAGESFHNYGLAVDLCFKDANGVWRWSKDDPWDKVHACALEHGLVPLEFEKAHLQVDTDLSARDLKQVAARQGLLALWDLLSR